MRLDWGRPDFLPPNVARRMARDDAREVREAKQAEAEREQLVEERHQRALSLAVAQAEGRGEYVSALEIATGQLGGRSFEDIFSAAVEAGDHQDQIAAARASREPGELELTCSSMSRSSTMRGREPAWRSSTGRGGSVRRRGRRRRRRLRLRRRRMISVSWPSTSMTGRGGSEHAWHVR